MLDGEDAVEIPRRFFTEILERIGDLEELKATLQVMALGAETDAPAVPLSKLTEPRIARAILPDGSPLPSPTRVENALDRAVADGILLRFAVESLPPSVYYLLATPEYRDLVDGLIAGDSEALIRLHLKADQVVRVYRPNVFALYEQQIGPLTPLIAEQLRDAERSYPRAWLEEAVRRAAQNNKRSWRYIQSILTSWESAGGPDHTLR